MCILGANQPHTVVHTLNGFSSYARHVISGVTSPSSHDHPPPQPNDHTLQNYHHPGQITTLQNLATSSSVIRDATLPLPLPSPHPQTEGSSSRGPEVRASPSHPHGGAASGNTPAFQESADEILAAVEAANPRLIRRNSSSGSRPPPSPRTRVSLTDQLSHPFSA